MKKIKDSWNWLMNNEALKRRLYVIIFESDTPMGKTFDVALLWVIVASIVLVIVESMRGLPMLAKDIFTVLEYAFTFFFTLEYLCRLYCAPNRLRYVFSFFGIIDLLSTLPLYLGWFMNASRYLMVLRTFRLIRVFRVFKLFSFLEEGDYLLRSLLFSFPKIMVFFLFVLIMAISLGTLMYMVEGGVPDSPFVDVPTSIYWSVVTMTTVGYGDITPVTASGRFLSAIVMLMGYTIIAVPTGIVSAQMMQDHGRAKQRKSKQPHCKECGRSMPENARFCPYCGKDVELPLTHGKEVDCP